MQNNYTVYFKSILTFNTEPLTLAKRNKGKFYEMDMKQFLTVGKNKKGT